MSAVFSIFKGIIHGSCRSTVSKMPWAPTNDFDDFQLAIQPECDTTLTYYGRNTTVIERDDDNNYENDAARFRPERNEILDRQHKLNLLSKIRENLVPAAIIGRRPTCNDIDNEDDDDNKYTVDHEIVSMIRSAGMGPSIDECLSSSRTIPAISSDRPHTNHRFPILFEENYFQLRPRKSTSKSSSENLSSPGSSANNSTTAMDPSRNDQDEGDTNDRSPKPSTSMSPGLSLVYQSNNGEAHEIEINLSALKSTRKRLGINFNVVKMGDSIKTRQFGEMRNSIKFITPTELYRMKRTGDRET